MPWKPRAHNAPAQQERRRQYDKQRGTRTQRGYDNAWLRFAKQFLAEHPLCEMDCQSQGIVTPATEVHHKRKLRERPDLKYEPSNLIASCKPCHSAATSRGE